jgi:prolyl 4-hydroxylase
MPAVIDIASLPRQYAGGTQMAEDPSLWLIENFANQKELAALSGAASEQLAPAMVSGAAGGYISGGRSGSNCWVAHQHDPTIEGLARRISQLVGLPLDHAESFQIVYYGPGEEYRPHYDGWEAGTERGDRCMARGGQRVVTALLYLNHVEGGGATHFPKLDISIHPVPGNLVLFHNCLPGTNSRHPLSLHGGQPVLVGEKWAANLWFRERDYRR